MNRLQSEFERLYLPRAQDRLDALGQATALIDASGRVRAMVMELTRPANWETLSKVWHGVQVEFGLPAPAIAVSGIDGVQLWFSLAEPIDIAQARVFLDGLRQRYLADVDTGRIRMMPASNASSVRQDLHAALVPALQAESGNWSAFLAPDLVPIFAESPWLDMPPNEEGQASLLRSIAVMTQPDFEAAGAKLRPPILSQLSAVVEVVNLDEAVAHARPLADSAGTDPAQFLLQIMQDDTVALALRIDAAKALLQHADHRHRKPGG